jgi:hypothetical protein
MNYPPPRSRNKYTRVREVATTSLKRFGPLVLTSLAAVAEHSWLKRDDPQESSTQMRIGNERDDKSSIQELRNQVAKMKRKLKGKGKENEETTSDASSTTSDQREAARGNHHHRRASFQDGRTSDQVWRGRQVPYETESHRHRHHHRHSFPHDDFSPQAIHAGKVAALAGAIEALHVGDLHGDWIGPKGVRVGTTMAASFASSYARDRDREDVRRREVVADVGTGLVVSRLVHGSSRRIEEDYQRGRERRWSYWY